MQVRGKGEEWARGRYRFFRPRTEAIGGRQSRTQRNDVPKDEREREREGERNKEREKERKRGRRRGRKKKKIKGSAKRGGQLTSSSALSLLPSRPCPLRPLPRAAQQCAAAERTGAAAVVSTKALQRRKAETRHGSRL